MDERLQEIIDKLTALDPALKPPPPVFTMAELQTWLPELMWGIGRTKPVNGNSDHGTAAVIPGHPSTTAFHPKQQADGSSDNLYVLLRLFKRIPLATFSTFTKVRYALSVAISNPLSCQAFEWECQKQSGGFINNMAYQLAPTNQADRSRAWKFSAFDYNRKAWIDTGVKCGPASFSGGKVLDLVCDFTCSKEGTVHDRLTVNTIVNPINFTQTPVPITSTDTAFNQAYQLDATKDALSYSVTLEGVSVSLS